MKLMNYIYTKNGIKNTRKNLFVLFISPWAIFVFAIIANVISGFVKNKGIHALQSNLPVIAIGCTLLSIYNIGLYSFKWWAMYKKEIAIKENKQ